MLMNTYELNSEGYIPSSSADASVPEWPFASAMQQHPTLVIKNDDLFLVTDRLGNVVNPGKGSVVTGLFCRDTRFLSRSELQIERRSPIFLSSSSDSGYSLQISCTNPVIEGKLKAESIGIHRAIVLRGGLFEEIEIRNYNTHAVQFELSLSFATDFQDLFEVRQYGDLRPQRGIALKPTCQLTHSCQHVDLSFAYRGLDGALMESHLRFTHLPPDRIQGYTAIWHLQLGSQETQLIGYKLQPWTNQQPIPHVSMPLSLAEARHEAQQEQDAWFYHITQIRSSSPTLNPIIERAEQDTYLLLQSFAKGKALAAGIPWYSALFGRDSIIAAWQTLMLQPTIARDTLLTLAHYQGQHSQDWRDEDPGKILHELRFGEMARNQEVPHSPYYGTVDATPLWLILYADYYAWTGDLSTIEQLWRNAIAAMNWIDRQCQATGYLRYARRAERGIDNQGWKDSGDCIVNRDGKLVEGPIALCEVQGYVYAAKLRLSHLATQLQQPDLAQRWRSDAEALKARFNRDFWLAEDQYCALALDRDGNPVDSITSNPGHCLQLGIFDPDKADRVAKRLRSPDLFSGWGIRTLSSHSPAYNPIGYHLGSVWPHDNALIAVGLRTLGYIDHAFTIAQGLFDMMGYQPDRRPPELICGYERQPGQGPVHYPVACSPQAWATASIFQLLQMMVNPIADAANHSLTIRNPALPDGIDALVLRNLCVGSSRVDLELERSGDTVACKVSNRQGNLSVIIEP